MELNGNVCGIEDSDGDDFEEWIFDLFDDMDMISFLYSNVFLDADHPYHFSHWLNQQFYVDWLNDL